jgi:uncharacterized membrane protein HdeD (DUF308 family)
MGAWAIIGGVSEIVAAIQLRKEIQGEWLLALSGLASVLFGLVALFWPGAGALTLVWLIDFYAVLFGMLLISLGLRLRGIKNKKLISASTQSLYEGDPHGNHS